MGRHVFSERRESGDVPAPVPGCGASAAELEDAARGPRESGGNCKERAPSTPSISVLRPGAHGGGSRQERTTSTPQDCMLCRDAEPGSLRGPSARESL